MIKLIILYFFVCFISSTGTVFGNNCYAQTSIRPIPDYSACSSGNPVPIPICDSMCNCYWVTQCSRGF